MTPSGVAGALLKNPWSWIPRLAYPTSLGDPDNGYDPGNPSQMCPNPENDNYNKGWVRRKDDRFNPYDDYIQRRGGIVYPQHSPNYYAPPLW